jgi:CRP/FNR family transcriptional regulator
MEKYFDEILDNAFPFWSELSSEDKKYITDNTVALSFPKGKNVHDGTECTGLFIIKSGTLRLYVLSEEGKEITLYRLGAGEICMLSAPCVIQSLTFDVLVDAEENTECLIISGCSFANLAERNQTVKIFTLETALSRFSDVVWVVQQILFMSFDKRLAIFLLDEAARIGSDTIKLTHEQIAKYMSSAREVVSRMMKYFVSEGIVEASRSEGIKIIDKKKLRKIAY